MNIWDLSHTLTNDTPVYPGDQGIGIVQAGEFRKDGFCDHVITLGSHAGTHVDAPAHMIDDGYVVLDDACCQVLIDKKVSMVGLDTASADNQDGFPVHKKLLGADILIIKNLTNLKELVGKKFEFWALPLKVTKDGAPVRAVARISE